MSVKTIFKRLYDPHYLIKGQWIGRNLSAKEAYARLFRIAWPSIVETVLISMISFIDTMMVSTVGHEAVAAVGLTTQPRNIFYSVFVALNIGVTAVVSRRRGENNREAANRTLAQALSICFILGVILFTTSYFLSEPLLLFMGAMDDTIRLAIPYFRITMLGTVFTSFGLIINAAHRGCGNAKISMVTNLTANTVNIFFNYFLINGVWFFPKLGVTGAAVATLIGNIVSFCMSIYSVTIRPGYLHLQLKNLFKLSKDVLAPITKVASGAAVEQLFVRIGFFAYAKLVASLGTESMATHQICMSVINLSFSIGDGLGMASSALIGRSLGERRGDLSLVFGKATQRVGLLFGMFLTVFFIISRYGVVSLFTDVPSIIKLGADIMIIIAFISPAQISQVVFTGSLKGAGDTKFVAVSSLISIAIIRPLITYVLCYPIGMGLIGAWLSLALDQLLRLIIVGLRFASGKWKSIKL